MKVFFAGTPEFSVPSLKVLAQDPGIDVLGVFSQPSKPRGRGQRVKSTPVSDAAKRLGLPLYEVKNINEKENLNILAENKVEFLVVVAFGQKLSPELLEIPEKGAVNLHASLLPRYRGANPIQRALLNGDNESGLSTMLMDEGWDTGPVLMQKTLTIGPNETFKTLHDKMAREGAPLLLETLKKFSRGDIEPKQQKGKVVYASKLKPEEMELNWKEDAEFLERKIRALNPFPGARTSYKGEEWKIFGAEIKDNINGFEPGRIKVIDNRELIVQTGIGALKIKELQRPGKKALPAEKFLLGFPLESGSCFNGKGEKNAKK